MKPVLVLALKDLKLIYRDKFGLFWLLVFPLLMALFFGSIFSGAGESGGRAAMKVAVVDRDNTDFSKAFVSHLDSSSAIDLLPVSADSARLLVRQGKAVAFLEIEPGFGRWQRMFTGDTTTTLITGLDPARQAESGYLQGLIMEAWFAQLSGLFGDAGKGRSFVKESLDSLDTGNVPSDRAAALRSFLGPLDTFLAQSDTGVLSNQGGEGAAGSGGFTEGPRIAKEDVFREQTGPRSAWEITFPQALLWALIGCTAAFAITIVNERTSGTLTRLRMAPLTRAHILAGKGAACFIAAVLVCSFLILFGKVLFAIRTPHPAELILAIGCSAICFTGLMMLISVMGKTEQAVAGAGWAILLVFSMIGGGMVPLMVMPRWMATISNFSPVKWGIYSLEGAIWRGFGWGEMLFPLSVLTGIGLVAYAVGVMIFRRTD